MVNINGTIKDVITGDSKEIQRSVFSVPVGNAMIEAWMAVKNNKNDSDDASVIFCSISVVLDAENGQILDVGTTGTGQVLFFFTPTDTSVLIPGRKYFYGMKAKLQDGKVGTFEQGEFTPIQGIVQQVV